MKLCVGQIYLDMSGYTDKVAYKLKYESWLLRLGIVLIEIGKPWKIQDFIVENFVSGRREDFWYRGYRPSR